MPLSQSSIDKLCAIHKKHTGEQLTSDEAWAMGERLVRLLDVLTRTNAVRSDVLRSSSPVRFDQKHPPS
jgi:hypothetical protein